MDLTKNILCTIHLLKLAFKDGILSCHIISTI